MASNIPIVILYGNVLAGFDSITKLWFLVFKGNETIYSKVCPALIFTWRKQNAPAEKQPGRYITSVIYF
jgi:hypothetical protein